jgi:hypothetical protein
MHRDFGRECDATAIRISKSGTDPPESQAKIRLLTTLLSYAKEDLGDSSSVAASYSVCAQGVQTSVAHNENIVTVAATLELMAERLENTTPPEHHDLEGAFERLESTVRACCIEGPHQSIAVELETFLALSRTAEDLVTSLANKV